jgi:hypothetical protein
VWMRARVCVAQVPTGGQNFGSDTAPGVRKLMRMSRLELVDGAALSPLQQLAVKTSKSEGYLVTLR